MRKCNSAVGMEEKYHYHLGMHKIRTSAVSPHPVGFACWKGWKRRIKANTLVMGTRLPVVLGKTLGNQLSVIPKNPYALTYPSLR